MLDDPQQKLTEPPQLLDAVVRAVRAVLRLFDDESARPAYVSRVGSVMPKTNKAGWPATVRVSLLASDDGPINWKRVLATARTPLLNITPEDVPELGEVISIAASGAVLGERLRTAIATTADESFRSDRFAQECLHLLAAVLSQLEGLTPLKDEHIRAAYRLVEQAEVADSLRYDLLVPLPLVPFPEGFALELEPGVRIRPLTESEQVARAPESPSIAEVNPYLLAAATHCLVLENRTVDNSMGALARSIRMSVEPVDLEIIELVCQTLHIALSTDVGYAQVCMSPIGWIDRWAPAVDLSTIQTYRRYPPRFERAGWNRKKATFSDERYAMVAVIYRGLSAGTRQARLAAQRLFQASLRSDSDDSLLDSCIGIEALLGEGRDELVHRMSLRAATALAAASRYHSPEVTYQLMKEVYKLRSQLVHGVSIKDRMIQIESKSIPATDAARYLLRWLIRAQVEAEPAWNPLALDRQVLEALRSLKVDSDA